MVILIIFILIILNGIFAMSEIALVSARKARLELKAAKGDEASKTALKLANNPDRLFSTVQIGITLIGILMGIYSGENIKSHFIRFFDRWVIFQPYSNTLAVISMVLLITYFTLVLGELVPKRLGLARPESVARVISGPMLVLSTITYPFIWLLTISTNAIVKILRLDMTKAEQVTEEEIKAMITQGTESGTVEEEEQDIIERVFQLGDRSITSLMTHRSEMVWLDIRDTPELYKRKIEESLHSVYPVCEGQLDEMRGVVNIKQLYLALPDASLKDLMTQPLFVPEGNSAYQVVEKFKEVHAGSAFIVDEYGSIQGMITLNNILEALVGDLPQAGSQETEITPREDRSFLIDGQIQFYDFLDYFGRVELLEEVKGDFDTLAGFLLHYLEHIPVTGEKLDWSGFRFEVVDMDGHRIDKVLVKRIPAEVEEG